MDQDDWKAQTQQFRAFPLKMLVFADDECAEDIGSTLSDHAIFLQEPTRLTSPLRYYNPHVLSWTAEKITPRFLGTPTPLEFADEVDKILKSLNSTDLPQSPQQDDRIRTKLQAYEPFSQHST